MEEEGSKPALGNREEMLSLYRLMVLIRRFEETAQDMYIRGKIGGFLHLNIGEEAAVAGSITCLEPRDYLFSNYREHGHALARGVDPKLIMAELFGKSTGTSKGRGGSMHLFDANLHFMGGYAIVGASLPLAAGAGLAIRYRGSDEIVMSIFGEGATNIGSFHESLNLAKLWHLPVLFYCVNNQYAMGSAVEKDSAVPEIYRKACAYDIPAERVDGMDVLAVREATQRMIRRTREEKEPMFLEALTYRFRGHSMADPLRYRTREEVQRWMQRDPIRSLREKLLESRLATEADLERIENDVERVVAEAVEFAERSPEPALEDLYKYVYSSGEGGA